MGAIKDLADLTEDLIERFQDRKFTEAISKIQLLQAALQSEQATLLENSIRLQSDNTELKAKIKELEEKIVKIQKQGCHSITPFFVDSPKTINPSRSGRPCLPPLTRPMKWW